VQAGGYGEHEFVSVLKDGGQTDGAPVAVKSSSCKLHLAPGTGARLKFQMRRHVNPPSLRFPWQNP
jgi:hypothetical protein